MSTATTTWQRERGHNTSGFGTQVPFGSINEPGCYICNWSGHLIRMPQDAVEPGRSPVMTITGGHPLFVTKISNDPFIPASKARLLAAECDLVATF